MPPPNKNPVIQTTTGEIYLPTRLVYTVSEPDVLRRRLGKHPSMGWDPEQQRWTWNYDRKARKLGFPASYDEVLKSDGGLVLASCHLVGKRSLHVYTRCGLRAARFLRFFDREVPRGIARGEFVDQYNLITTAGHVTAVPAPDEYFRDESQIEFFDVAALLDGAKTPAEQAAVEALCEQRTTTATIVPLQRNRLELFYEDGPKAFEEAMEFRDVMAALQYQSDRPIRPYEVVAGK